MARNLPSFPRPELDALIQHSIKVFNSLAPEQQRQHREAQRRSWCVGELMLENPEMTKQQANALYDRAVLGVLDHAVLSPNEPEKG